LEIEVEEGARLPKAKQRRFNREEALEVKRQLDDLLKNTGITIRLGGIDFVRVESRWIEALVHGSTADK
jgi:hypothetical protein